MNEVERLLHLLPSGALLQQARHERGLDGLGSLLRISKLFFQGIDTRKFRVELFFQALQLCAKRLIYFLGRAMLLQIRQEPVYLLFERRLRGEPVFEDQVEGVARE